MQTDAPDFALVFHKMPGLCLGEARPAKPVKSIQWIDLSAERRSSARSSALRGRDRRELRRAATMPAPGEFQ